MGKKTTSERINALRKRYDAFLEEDKRRKERNDFILGRFDKLRSSTKVMPTRHKENPHMGEHFMTQKRPLHLGYYDKVSRIDERNILNSGQAQMTPIITKELTGSTMLKEISKKFILIPKLQTTPEYITSYKLPNENGDNDWKSKYNILDELKKVEKGVCLDDKAEPGNSDFGHQTPICDTKKKKENLLIHPKPNAGEDLKLNDLQISEDYPCTNTNDPHIASRLLLEKDGEIIKNDKSCNDVEIFNNDSNKEHSPIHSLKGKDEAQEKHGSESELKVSQQNIEKENFNQLTNEENVKKDCNQHQLSELNQSQLTLENPNSSSNDVNLTMESNEKNENSIIPKEIEASTPSMNIINQLYFKRDEVSIGQAQNVINEDIVPNENAATDSSVVTNNPELNEIPPTSTITDDIFASQIEDFEAEQTEMQYIYSNEETYDQSNLDTQEQSNQYLNDQYSYYNEMQTEERPYYTEVNEHEESTERYDPNYPQQYQNNYDKEIVGKQLYEVYGHEQEVTNENYEQQPVNYDYVNDENQQIDTNMNYGSQIDDADSSYEHQQGVAANFIQESQQINYEQTSAQYGTVNTSNIENPPNEITNSDSQQIDSKNINEEQQIPRVHVVQQPIEIDDATMQPELETIETIERQLDKEDDYIEGEKPPDTLKKIPEPENVA